MCASVYKRRQLTRSRSKFPRKMAQSEKNFRDLLCEGRAQPPETSDPAAARTIDELRKQVTKLRGELESERQKVKEEEWEHEKELKRLREELEKKLDVTVEALAVRKDQEKQTDLKKFEERLRRQMDMERKTQEREKAEEVRRVQRRLERERNDSIRHAVEDERRTALEEMQKMMPEDECAMREAKLAREVFLLGEQNEQLQEAVRNLSGENRSQIDLIRRMKQEHEAEITSLIKQCHMDASRDMAQIRLAERLIAEKEADIQAVGYRADVAMLEKEALAEELVTMKSVLSVGSSSAMEPTSSPTMTRVCMVAMETLSGYHMFLLCCCYCVFAEKYIPKNADSVLRPVMLGMSQMYCLPVVWL